MENKPTQNKEADSKGFNNIKLLDETIVIARNRYEADSKTENKKVFADFQANTIQTNHKELNTNDVATNLFILRDNSKVRNTLDNETAIVFREKLNIKPLNW